MDTVADDLLYFSSWTVCRLFNPAQWHRVFMWSLGIACLLQFVAVSFVIVLGCKPVAASWDFTIDGASCIDAIEFVYYCYYAAGQSVTHSLLDNPPFNCFLFPPTECDVYLGVSRSFQACLIFSLPAFSTALDLYLAVYPATQLSRLSCSLKKKASLSVMLGLGVL